MSQMATSRQLLDTNIVPWVGPEAMLSRDMFVFPCYILCSKESPRGRCCILLLKNNLIMTRISETSMSPFEHILAFFIGQLKKCICHILCLHITDSDIHKLL